MDEVPVHAPGGRPGRDNSGRLAPISAVSAAPPTDESVDDSVPTLDPSRTAREEFDSLYRLHRRDIERLCQAILHNRADAEDATEEAFTRAWRSMVSTPGTCTYPWLRVVARNHSFDVLRRRGRSCPVDTPELEAASPRARGCDGEVIDGIDAELARESVRRVSPRHRTLLNLREGLGLTYQEIADHESIPLSSVESGVYRARRALRREFLALVGPEGVASLIWLRFRTRSIGVHGAVSQLFGNLGDRVAPMTAPAASLGSAVAATAVAAIVVIGPVSPLAHRPISTESVPPVSAPTHLQSTIHAGPERLLPTVAPKSAIKRPSLSDGTRHSPSPRRRHLMTSQSTGSSTSVVTSVSNSPTTDATLTAANGTQSSTQVATSEPVTAAPTPKPVILAEGTTTGSTTTAASSTYADQFAMPTGARGAVTYAQTSGSTLVISRSGGITTDGTLPAGSYVATGTDSDSAGDTGSWTFSLTVAPVSLIQGVKSAITTITASRTFQFLLTPSGALGTVTFTLLNNVMGLNISSAGLVNTNSTLLPGIYVVQGTDADNFGDSGTFEFVLTVVLDPSSLTPMYTSTETQPAAGNSDQNTSSGADQSNGANQSFGNASRQSNQGSGSRSGNAWSTGWN